MTTRIATALRQAGRALRASPVFTAAAVAVLGIGVGADTAIFTVVKGVLLEPLPLPGSERLVILCERHPSIPGYCVGSVPNVTDLAARGSTLASAGLARGWAFSFDDDLGRLRASAGIATPGFWRTLGGAPASGRWFADDEIGEDADVLLIAHSLWTSRYGADPEVVGRTVSVDGTPHVIVGVLPEGLEVPTLEWIQVWRPLHFDPSEEERREWRGFTALGRLEDGSDLSEARTDLAAVYRSLGTEHAAITDEWRLEVAPLKDHLVGDVRPMLLVFLGAVGVLLLIACANVANLLLLRSARRSRELAVRAALGAGRGDLVGAILSESLLLAMGGGVAGLLLAAWGTDLFVSLAPAGIPRIDNVAVDRTVFAFAVTLSLATAVVFGLVPALRTRETDLAAALRAGRTGPGLGARRLRGAFVVAEIALSLVLLATSGLLARSFVNFLRWEPGFEREGLAAMSVFFPDETWDGSDELVALFRRAEEVARSVPGVTDAAIASSLPLLGGREPIDYHLAEQVPASGDDLPSALVYDVGPGYFSTLGVPVVRGREFAETDDASAAPALVVNESFAARSWPGGDPLGKLVVVPPGNWGSEPVTYEVVGVAADVTPLTPGEPPEPEVYRSNRQYSRPFPYVVIRARGDAAAVAGQVAEAVLAQVSPDLSVNVAGTMRDLVERRLVRPRFNLLLVGAFAAAAILLTVVGVYSVLAFAVTERTREMGIRLAMGSTRDRVVGVVLVDGVRLAAWGIGLGLVGYVAVSGVVEGVVFGVTPTDPATLAGVAGLIAVLALAASALPAIRASRVDPVDLLRQE